MSCVYVLISQPTFVDFSFLEAGAADMVALPLSRYGTCVLVIGLLN